jgi:hypothetical protein
MDIFTKAFWIAAIERAIRFAAITVLANGVGDLVSLTEVESWTEVLGIAGMGALISLLTSLSIHTATKTGPAFTTAETLSPPAPAIPVE